MNKTSKTHLIWSFLLTLLCLGCENFTGYSTDTLEIHSINEKVFIHKSFLQTEDYGKVDCNGLIYVNNGEAIVFDTPPDDSISNELISYVTKELKAEIVAIVPTHFHGDCLGGLNAFHEKGITSVANQLTIDLAGKAERILPQQGFVEKHAIKVGNEHVLIKHVGEGHTRDNVIGVIPHGNVIFGGCLIKHVGANQGYTGDANVDVWPETVARIKAEFPETKTIIPGHGKWGGMELLDYTIELFTKE